MLTINSLDYTKPIIHICIDVQDRYLSDLHPKRQMSFVSNVRQFAMSLRPNVQTVWVGWHTAGTSKTYDRLQPWPSIKLEYRKQSSWCSTPPVKRLGLGGVFPASDEVIYEKGTVSAFGFSESLVALLPYGAQLIFTGMRTEACVRHSVQDAALSGFSSYVVYDLLADSFMRSSEDSDPEHHRSTLLKLLAIRRDNIGLICKSDLLAYIKSSPAPPHTYYPQIRKKHSILLNLFSFH